MTDTAYYNPAPYWALKESGWIKSLLLFFDDVAILLPRYMYGRHTDADPYVAGPLEERGLLRVLEPNDWVDQELANQLAEVIVELLTNGTFNDLPKAGYFPELSQSRIGYGADIDLAGFLVDELEARGLARPSQDGVSIPLHPHVRTTILVILAQLSRVAGKKRGMTIHPVTNNAQAVQDLISTLSQKSMPSRHQVIELDLEPVSFDLSAIPLDDVLQFRVEHQDAHRAYMRDLRSFLEELAVVDDSRDREQVLLQRRQELADAAHDIQRSSRRALGKNLSAWSLGIAGGAMAIASGNPVGLALSAAGLIIGMVPSEPRQVSAYSYLFAVDRSFRN